MNTQELIQEAAVIRDERNQYANTAERVGTALVHMAEQIAAQAADVDKIEADVRGTLTLSQLDNPLGFTTNAQWGQGLNEDKSYTFRLVDTSGRCIGHVWLLNDADHWDSSKAARLIEVVMCCATINEEGVLTTDARWGSPRLYYRTFCTSLSGGTPDGGYPSGIFKWSAWQEYRDYVAQPIKDALAALQQQHATDVAALQAKHATDVADLQAKHATDVANLKAIKEKTDRLRDLGNYSTIGELDNAAAAIVDRSVQMSVGDLPFLMYGTVGYNTVIYLQTVEDRDEPSIWQMRMYEGGGSGMMQRRLWLDETDFEHNILVVTSAEEFTLFIPNGINVEQDSNGMILRLKDQYGGAMGSKCIVNEATTTAAGVMTALHVQELAHLTNMWLQIDEEFAEIEDLVTYFSEHPDISLNDTYKFFSCRISNDRSDYHVLGMKSVRPDADKTYACVGLYLKYGECYDVIEVAFYLEDGQWFLDETAIYTPVNQVGVRYEGGRAFLCKYYSSDYVNTTKEPLNTANTIMDGLMSADHVKKLANLEARIAALEAK